MFYYIKAGYKRVYFSWTCFLDEFSCIVVAIKYHLNHIMPKFQYIYLLSIHVFDVFKLATKQENKQSAYAKKKKDTDPLSSNCLCFCYMYSNSYSSYRSLSGAVVMSLAL